MARLKSDGNSTFAISTRNLLNSIQDPIAILDNEGFVVAINDAWVLIWQKYRNPFCNAREGNNFLELCEATEDISSENRRRIEDGIKKIITGEQHDLDYKIPVNFGNRSKWFLFHANKISAEISGIIISIAEIPNEWQLERELIESESRYRALFENANDAIFITHFHPDHVSDLVPFLFASNYTYGAVREKSFYVIGPEGLEQFYHWVILFKVQMPHRQGYWN